MKTEYKSLVELIPDVNVIKDLNKKYQSYSGYSNLYCCVKSKLTNFTDTVELITDVMIIGNKDKYLEDMLYVLSQNDTDISFLSTDGSPKKIKDFLNAKIFFMNAINEKIISIMEEAEMSLCSFLCFLLLNYYHSHNMVTIYEDFYERREIFKDMKDWIYDASVCIFEHFHNEEED